MPVNLVTNEKGTILVLDGVITAEDTDQFIASLKEYPELVVDLSDCEHLHTAVLQAILILRPSISRMPSDPFWSRCFSSFDIDSVNATTPNLPLSGEELKTSP